MAPVAAVAARPAAMRANPSFTQQPMRARPPTRARPRHRRSMWSRVLSLSLLGFGIYAMTQRQWVVGGILLGIWVVWFIINIFRALR